jgi:hypothetical protein
MGSALMRWSRYSSKSRKCVSTRYETTDSHCLQRSCICVPELSWRLGESRVLTPASCLRLPVSAMQDLCPTTAGMALIYDEYISHAVSLDKSNSCPANHESTPQEPVTELLDPIPSRSHFMLTAACQQLRQWVPGRTRDCGRQRRLGHAARQPQHVRSECSCGRQCFPGGFTGMAHGTVQHPAA